MPKPIELSPADLAVSKPILGGPTLTVGQIAAGVTNLAADQPATRERIRHWTREGFLSPIERHHAGTGRHHGYDPVALYHAGVLTVLVGTGIPLASRRDLLETAALVRTAVEHWNSGNCFESRYLTISHPANGPPVLALQPEPRPNPNSLVTIIVDLFSVFGKVSEQLAATSKNRRGRSNRLPP
jgi:hypothetical protein